MGEVAEGAEGGLIHPLNSFGSEQQISHHCHQADEVKEGENDTDWRSFHPNKLILSFD